jgi:hypothetical protein
MNFQSAGTAKVKSIRCCVLFDPKDGSIRHVNRVITMEGAVTTSEKEMEQRTLRLAASLGLETKRLQTLHVNHEAFIPGRHYKVLTKTRSLTEIGKKGSRTIGGKRKSVTRKSR